MSDIDQQFQLEEHADGLDKNLRKANRQSRRRGRQLESAEVAAQSFSEQLDSDRQLQAINELWQQLQDSQAAHAAAQQQQADQQMQAVHAESVLAEMKEQLEADKLVLSASLLGRCSPKLLLHIQFTTAILP